MESTSSVFKKGFLTVTMDGGWGSSGKGSLASYLWQKHRSSHTTFAVNAYMSNAGHTLMEDDGTEVLYQCLNSIAHLKGQYEKIYIGPGAVFAKHEILGEITLLGMTKDTLGIHPLAAIATDKDINYERGTHDFEGNAKETQDSANIRLGSTLHGVGAARARRVLRRDDVVLAKDIPELIDFICDTSSEIMSRLNNGESGLMEIAQGYTLSMFSKWYPKTTSRNCTVAAALDDNMIPVRYAGPVAINYRTLPIRVNNNKYVRISDNKFLTWPEWEATPEDDRKVMVGDSGGVYDDQTELSWEEVSELAGTSIFEITSISKLPRRVFTFSQKLLEESVLANDTGHEVYISVNFLNYIDGSVAGVRDVNGVKTSKIADWMDNNMSRVVNDLEKKWHVQFGGLILGTGPKTMDRVYID
jgi:hypothetical protein